MRFIYPPKAKHSTVSQITKALSLGALVLLLGIGGSKAIDGLRSFSKRSFGSSAEVSQHQSLEQLVDTTFSVPLHLEIVREADSSQSMCPTAYVFDAGTSLIHRFGCAEPLHSTGQYIPPGKAVDRSQEYLDIFSPERSDGRRVPFLVTFRFVKVPLDGGDSTEQLDGSISYNTFVEREDRRILTLDNLDGSITRYDIPYLNYISRRKFNGQLTNIQPDYPSTESERSWRKANGFSFNIEASRQKTVRPFRDDASSEEIVFDYIISFLGEDADFSFGAYNTYNTMPVLAFSDQQQTAIYGYLCDNGDIETYQRFRYSDLSLERNEDSTMKPPLSLDVYGLSIFIIQQGVQKVEVITVDKMWGTGRPPTVDGKRK